MPNELTDLQTTAEHKIHDVLEEFFRAATKRLAKSSLAPGERAAELDWSLLQLVESAGDFWRAVGLKMLEIQQAEAKV